MSSVLSRFRPLFRYSLLSFITLLLCFLILPPSVFSQTNVQPTTQTNYSGSSSLQFQPSTGTYNKDDTFDVDINLDTRNLPVYGVKLMATYDQTLIQPISDTITSLTKNTRWSPPNFNKVNRGQIILDYGKNQPAFTGNSPIARITFKALKPGQAQMDFIFFQQFDNNNPNVSTVYGKRDGVNISNVLTDVINGIFVIASSTNSCNATCENDSDCASGYCYQPPFYCPPGRNCPHVMPLKVCRYRDCQNDSNCTCSQTCSNVGDSCGTGFAGNSLGNCCEGLSCIESGMPDAGGTCQTNTDQCYPLPACVNENPPCSINIPNGMRPCPITQPPPPINCQTHQNGDANCDGLINDRDYRIWEYEMQFSQLPFKRADFNSDGREDMVDFEIWRRNSQGADICSTTDNTASMTYDEAKQIAENSICTSEGIIRDEGRDYCNNKTGTWWLPFTSLSNSKPGCSPICVVDIASKSADINWRCTGLITPSPSLCCSQNQLDNGYQCIENCGPPVAHEGDAPPGFSCLSSADVTSREQYGCPI